MWIDKKNIGNNFVAKPFFINNIQRQRFKYLVNVNKTKHFSVTK